MLRDFRTAPIGDDDKALFELLEKVNEASWEITKDDVDRVRAHGWSDEAVYDALTVSALFNFYNKWIDSTGVHDMSPEAYAIGGKRLAEDGYVVPDTGDAGEPPPA